MNLSVIEQYINHFRELVWSGPVLVLVFGSGIFLTLYLRALPFRYLGLAFREVFSKEKTHHAGDISHFESLMTSLASSIGTGSIVGVATALVMGGLGAIFWMWVMAFFGITIKYAESLLAVKYRSVDANGEMAGGPMYYMERGLGWRWLGILYAVPATVAAIGIGNSVQVNSIASSLNEVFGFSPLLVGIGVSVCTGLVLLGGVKTVGKVASVLVPLMGGLYLAAGIGVILMNLTAVPTAMWQIISSAMHGQAAFGGFAGASMMVALRTGVARSIFSSEAGMGISAIAAAAAKTDNAGRQGMVAMTGALVSTLLVCTVTGLAIAVSGIFGEVDADGVAVNGARLAIRAFEAHIIGGRYAVTLGLVLFAYTTIVGWAYYGEKCCEYIAGVKSVIPYRIIYTLAVVPGAILNLELVWAIADAMNAVMVIPNIVAILFLAPVIRDETVYFEKLAKREMMHKKA